MPKKEENKGEWIYATVGCFALGGFVGGPLSWGLYGAGALMAGIRILDSTSKYEVVFKELKLCNESEKYPIFLSKNKRQYGYDLRFSCPIGLSLKDFENNHAAFEAYFKHRVVIEYDKGKNILMRIYEHELKNRYDFNVIPCSKILEIPIGYTYGDLPVKIDIEEAPHTMIAGSTGAGKSVLLNDIMTNLALKDPNLLEVYIIDFKGNEFTDFEDLSMVKAIATEILQAERLLMRLKVEMEERYKLFKEFGTGIKKLSDYNKKAKVKLPYKILIVDEYADLMGKDGKTCKEINNRLLQKARGAGIHLILSTQRDDSNVIDGFAKNNINCIVGLTCANDTSSRVIIGRNGLEKLTKNGHFIIKDNGEEIEGRAMYIDSDDIKEALKDVPRKKQGAAFEEEKKVDLKVLDKL